MSTHTALAQKSAGKLSQTDSLENPIPHIDVPTKFNQGTSESAHERRNRL
jgi:hypothetical protein